ncbi:GatB/YqeY domain-containing protein [Bosea sp. BIWAKO-01]|uniref:GatB/YqeY domain-containing protein n=1 Tax=Bosea sp. BIWAKO-01 TaxID=506668 RepID=UPI00086B89D9|nr:GatB/YqeY domain-containing protein [Bosea sp. BIWAKO-01]GAU83715.1 transamidase GatB domain protein [Bosea sp. BIWAKO-01]
MTNMTSLRERFTSELKEAMKAGEKGKVGAIRLIQAALKDKDIEARGAGKGEASADEILALLQKMIKQRQESIAIYDANGRPELAAGERAEVDVISAYLPKQMDEGEVKAAIAAAVTESGAASVKDMGKVIAILRANYAGQMDFAKASGLVKAALGG